MNEREFVFIVKERGSPSYHITKDWEGVIKTITDHGLIPEG